MVGCRGVSCDDRGQLTANIREKETYSTLSLLVWAWYSSLVNNARLSPLYICINIYNIGNKYNDQMIYCRDSLVYSVVRCK